MFTFKVLWSEVTMKSVKEVKALWKPIIESYKVNYKVTYKEEGGVRYRSYLDIGINCYEYDGDWVEGYVVERWKEVG